MSKPQAEGKLNISRELLLTKIAIAVTLAAIALSARDIFGLLVSRVTAGNLPAALEQVIFISIVAFIIYGSLVYQFARVGYLKRLSRHRPASQDELDAFAYGQSLPSLTFLVPSYREEERVIRQALLSCALQEYPNRRVALLIDDPPNPTKAADRSQLQATRRLPLQLQQEFARLAARYSEVSDSFLFRKQAGPIDKTEELETLSGLFFEAARWFQEQAASFPVTDHTDRLFVEKVLLERQRRLFQKATELKNFAVNHGQGASEEGISREYLRLTSLFRCEFHSFERKRYVNLSHEPNKAMNLNSYIGLLGKGFREVVRGDGAHLELAPAQEATIKFPDADYITTLDADSLLLPEYALRLIYIMEQLENSRVAVAQTPYSAVPGSTSQVERIAGATTDIQYLIHQGFTHYGATYWVGANAVLRRAALEDIKEAAEERGFPITRYIQDRTVIEDTESTVDLVRRGWQLYNYPERLSYSATPPDFGSLLIQRRRWANGGLIILPKLLRYLLRRPFQLRRASEGMMRVHYLASVAAVNAGFLAILIYPFEDSMRTFWLPLTAVPYFFLYGRDMVNLGYRPGDLARVYALNLMLVPVHIGGVLKSIQQLCFRKKIPFGRTPKIQGRTAAPAMYVLAEYGLLAYSIWACGMDISQGYYAHAAFSMVNALFFSYVALGFIGIKASREDIFLGRRFKRPGKPPGLAESIPVLESLHQHDSRAKEGSMLK